jgi:hypothetical protein
MPGLFGLIGDAGYLLLRGVGKVLSPAGATSGGSALATVAVGTALVGGGYLAYDAYKNPQAVAIPSHLEGSAPAPQFSGAGDTQSFVNFKPANAPNSPGSTYNSPVLKRTHESMTRGAIAQAAQPSFSQQNQGIVAARPQVAAPAPAPRGPTLETLVSEYERAFADSIQVMAADAAKKDQMDREKARIFDQIAAIVFPEPKAPASKEALDYIGSRMKEDPRAIQDLVQSIQFLESASK